MEHYTLPIETKDIEKIIPHRNPFLLVDRVLAVESGHKITALKNVTMNEPFFKGHFPGYPIMPGVLIIEALAQTAGILATLSFNTAADELYFFAAISNARFKKPVLPGDTLLLEAELINQKSGIGKFKARALVAGDLAAAAEITCARKKIN